MFERLAKILPAKLRPKKPQNEAGRFHLIHTNDNRPGFRRPEGRRQRPQQALACRWSLAPDGRRLQCGWKLGAPERPADNRPMPLVALG